MALLTENQITHTVEVIDYESYESELIQEPYILYEDAYILIQDDTVKILDITKNTTLYKYDTDEVTISTIKDKCRIDDYKNREDITDTEYTAVFNKSYPERKYINITSTKGVLAININASDSYENSILIKNPNDVSITLAFNSIIYKTNTIKTIMKQGKELTIDSSSAKILYVKVEPDCATITLSQSLTL